MIKSNHANLVGHHPKAWKMPEIYQTISRCGFYMAMGISWLPERNQVLSVIGSSALPTKETILLFWLV